MKVLTLIFSFYILAMAVMPCGDKEDCNNQSSELAASADKDHSDHEGDEENCSLFCICACCGQSVTAPDLLVAVRPPAQFRFENHTIYKVSFVSGAVSQIWLPPEIS
ncbi:MAG: DUF6660 family protein [Bacteroidia bacterium]